MVPARSNRHWALRIGLIGFVVFVAWWVTRPKPITDWVTVRADAHAVFERPFHMRVEVARTGAASQMLAIDLHWATLRHEPRGFLSSSRPRQVGAQGGAYDFEFSLPDRDDLGYIFAVLYTGPSARWDERTQAAFTDSVPVVRTGDTTQHVGLVPLPAHDHHSHGGTPASPSAMGGWLIAFVWLAAAFPWIYRWRVAIGAGGRYSPADMRSAFFCVLGCVFAACWEISAAETTLGTSARKFAIDAHLYHARHPFQIAGTIAILAAAAAVVTSIFERSHLEDAKRLLWLGLNLFAALSLVGFLSLNSVDLLANTLVLSLPVIQWLKLACAVIALLGSMRASRWKAH